MLYESEFQPSLISNSLNSSARSSGYCNTFILTKNVIAIVITWNLVGYPYEMSNPVRKNGCEWYFPPAVSCFLQQCSCWRKLESGKISFQGLRALSVIYISTARPTMKKSFVLTDVNLETELNLMSKVTGPPIYAIFIVPTTIATHVPTVPDHPHPFYHGPLYSYRFHNLCRKSLYFAYLVQKWDKSAEIVNLMYSKWRDF